MVWQYVVWALVAMAAVGAAAGYAFWASARRAPAIDPATAPEAELVARALASRPRWLFDLGLAVGCGLAIAGAFVGGPGLTLLALGTLLALLSITGRFLIVGGRRRLEHLSSDR